MRLGPCAVLCSLVGFFAAPLLASQVTKTPGPTIIVNGDPPIPFTPVTTDAWVFGADASGGGYLGFTNETGQTWTRMDVLVTLPTPETITCGGTAFATCTVVNTTPPGSSAGPTSYDVIFGGGPDDPIVNMENFTIDMNNDASTNPNGSGGWPANQDFQALANVPEPGSVLLAALGLLLFGAYRLLFSGLARKRFSKAAN